MQLVKEGDEEDAQVKILEQDGDREQISAADYDPSLDRREDEQKRVRGGVNDTAQDKLQTLREEEEEIEEEVEEEMEVDDMFSISTTAKKVKKVKRVVVCVSQSLAEQLR